MSVLFQLLVFLFAYLMFHLFVPKIGSKQELSKLLAGKKVVITGASAGIGKQIAVEIAKYELADIFIVSRSTSKLNTVRDHIVSQGYTGRVHVYAADLSLEVSIAITKP